MVVTHSPAFRNTYHLYFSGKILKFEQKNEENVDMDEGQMTCSGSDMIGDDLNLDSSNIIPEAAMQCGILPLQQTEDISQDIDLMQRQINLQSDTTNPNVNMASMTSPNGRCLTPPIMQHMPTTLSTTSTEGPTVSVMADGGGGGEDGEECCRNGGGGSMAEECVGCRRPITERYLLKVMDQSWHEDCLKCSCCDCRLGEVGSTLFTRANLMLCRRDYLRLFGATGYCSACSKAIPAFEMVMKTKGNVYHLECFACHQCNHRFCIGDRYYLHDNKILCEFDYEERLVFARLSQGYGGGTGGGGNSINNNNNNNNNASSMPHHAKTRQVHHHHPPHPHQITSLVNAPRLPLQMDLCTTSQSLNGC